MAQKLYIRPIGLADSPQSEEGSTIRLAGGLVYASRFALIVREGTQIISRRRFGADEANTVFGALPDPLAAEAAVQWTNLKAQHGPLSCGARTLRLDQPQVMGILNVTGLHHPRLRRCILVACCPYIPEAPQWEHKSGEWSAKLLFPIEI